MSRKRILPVVANGSTLPIMVGAVIYVRVSTKEQTENLSLPTQLRACEEYCRRQGYEILERFHEEGESAKSADRSQLQNLPTYCRLNKGRVHFVVVFNLTRFARDKYDHFALRSHLQSLGISLRSATEPIDDTSTGKLMEGVLAAFAQFDNDCRSDRTRAGMKAALELGRWVFLAPIGYLNAPRATSKSLMADPERAPLVRRAFEEYATGRFTKEQLLKQVRAWGLTNRRGRPLTSQAIGVLLRNRLYAGIVDVTEYGVRGKRGDFEPLISEDLFYRAQAVLSGRLPSTTPKQRAHPDFPMRGFIRCASCGRGLTGSWSKGRSRVLRVLPLPPWLPCSERHESQTRRAIRRRTRAAAADARLHAATEGIRAADLEDAEGSRTRGTRERGASCEGHSRQTRPSRRSVPLRALNRHRHLRPPGRETARRAQRSPGSTVTPASSKNSTWRASWRSQNAFYRARRICGCRRHSNSASGSNNCSFPTEFRSMETALLEPA